MISMSLAHFEYRVECLNVRVRVIRTQCVHTYFVCITRHLIIQQYFSRNIRTNQWPISLYVLCINVYYTFFIFIIIEFINVSRANVFSVCVCAVPCHAVILYMAVKTRFSVNSYAFKSGKNIQKRFNDLRTHTQPHK